ncbi:MAG: class I SAM-dependent methyltransferase [Hyellaceae cyanobacterium CSU_1_1]|nr:class I SAM-dependent methyltransferase [Hyellaceae cyanobacterium CSU_1_1]
MEVNRKSIQKKIADKWTTKSQNPQTIKNKWWKSKHIIRAINMRVAGLPLDGQSAGLVQKAKEMAGTSVPFSLGVSVGCGAGDKEMSLISQGLVEKFILYELSEYRVELGRNYAKSQGLSDRVTFVVGDAFEMLKQDEYCDFIHWNNSLHHMLDTEQAIKWSYKLLKKGGMFYMDDYVGKNYLQFNFKTSEICTRIRNILPKIFS